MQTQSLQKLNSSVSDNSTWNAEGKKSAAAMNKQQRVLACKKGGRKAVWCLTCTGGSEDGSLWDEQQLALAGGVLAVRGQVELRARRQVGQIGQVVRWQLKSSHDYGKNMGRKI